MSLGPDLFARARAQHLAGHLSEAEALYRAAAPQWHRLGAYWLWLALLAKQLDQPAAALQSLSQALARRADLAANWRQFSPAMQTYALELSLACLTAPEPGPEADARQTLHSWLAWLGAQPLPPDALTRIWEALLPERLPQLEVLLAQRPWPGGLHLLARERMRQGRRVEADTLWQRLLALNPQDAAAHFNAGHLALQAGRIETALEHYEASLASDPRQPGLHYHLGRLLLSLLNEPEALAHLDSALALGDGASHPLWRIQRALAYRPLLPAGLDPADINHRLLASATALRQSVELTDCLADLQRGGIEPCFDLSYFSEDEAPVRAAFADIFRLPPKPIWPPPMPGPLRLGVFSSPGHEGLFLFGSLPLLAALTAAGVQVTVLAMPASLPLLADFTRYATLQPIPAELGAAAAAIRSLDFDLLYHWEVGTDPLNYFLPMLRPARTQFTSWGSVSTTGQTEVNYFLSADHLETPGSRGTYRETLLTLPVLPYLFSPEMLPNSGKDRAALGLPEGLLLGCPHNPQKLNGAFLDALGAILTAVPGARVVLIASRHQVWQSEFEQRLRHHLGAAAARALWMPRLPSDDFGSLLQACDLILEPFAFGSGKLAFEALGQGLPMLTLPGNRLRGRILSACYRQIDYPSLIAADAQDYVDKARALLLDPAARQHHSAEILSRRNLLTHHPDLLPNLMQMLHRMAGR